MEAGSVPDEVGYPAPAVAGAILATLFFPLIALIAALLLQGGQPDPKKKSQLRTWAWASGGWLVFGVLIAVLLVGVVAGNGSGGF
jgi:cytochrome bd-type quinol oxidase subunit 2